MNDKTATQSGLEIDTDLNAARQSANSVMNLLRDYIPQACFRKANEELIEVFYSSKTELTTHHQRKIYEAMSKEFLKESSWLQTK